MENESTLAGDTAKEISTIPPRELIPQARRGPQPTTKMALPSRVPPRREDNFPGLNLGWQQAFSPSQGQTLFQIDFGTTLHDLGFRPDTSHTREDER